MLGNAARDARNKAQLKKLGWEVLTIWECCLQQDTEKVINLLESLRSEQSRKLAGESIDAAVEI